MKQKFEILPPSASNILAKEVRQVIPSEVFQELRFWKKLTDRQQNVVQSESQQLAQAMLVSGISDLAKGQHLLKIHEVLKPLGHFEKFLRFARIHKKQAYRYMNGYKNAASRLSEPVLKAAMVRNIRIFSDDPEKPFGVFTHAVRQLTGPSKPDERVGPGPSASPEKVVEFLDNVEKFYKKEKSHKMKAKKQSKANGHVEAHEGDGDPEELARSFIRTWSQCLRRLPYNVNTKKRQAWIDDAFGMAANLAGIQSGVNITPIAVPEKYRPKPVGRPKEEEVKAANE